MRAPRPPSTPAPRLRPRAIAAFALAALPASNPAGAWDQGMMPRPRPNRPAAQAPAPAAPARPIPNNPAPHFSRGEIQEGRVLFAKTWVVGEPSRHGGDGLGPLFNATSCRECHDRGGLGGAGEANVELLNAFAGRPRFETGDRVFRGELAALHPAFRSTTSAMIHAAGTDEGYEGRRLLRLGYDVVQDRVDLIALSRTKRNTPSLFGAGLIDRIPDAVLIEAEKKEHEGFPGINGRVSALRDGRIGRFGWKGQTATLRDFVMQACAGELGLEVPGRHQPDDRPEVDPAGNRFDLDEKECRQLFGFVATLPAPIELKPTRSHPGRFLFEQAGCATCHPRQLGSVEGIYSDLLLHNIGAESADSGVGYYAPANGTEAGPIPLAGVTGRDEKPTGPAIATEWRTPPLWGIRDSAPYWHDGRASTLDAAIMLHQGEASDSAERYQSMTKLQRTALLQFVAALGAPAPRRR